LVDTHFKVAKVVRIRYFARGWNIEEVHASVRKDGEAFSFIEEIDERL
jgi:hypothetical protein